MNLIKRYLCLLTALMALFLMTGCWNYREIDRMAIVAGVAVDKGTAANYKLTIEIVDISHEKVIKPKAKVISSEGDSIFDAARNAIAVAGKRLYWSHAKVIIIGQEVAENGVVKILDWYMRDAETRADVNLLISGEETAGEIFTEPETDSDIISITLHEIFKNQKSLSKAPDIQIWRFINMLTSEGVSPIATEVRLKEEGEKKIPELSGTAIFSKDKFIGFLDGEQTLYMQMIQDNIEGGILVQKEHGVDGETVISLEVFDSKTKTEPTVATQSNITMNITTNTDVSIDEIESTTNYIEDGMREKLIQDIETTLKQDLENNVKLVQSEFGVDIYGFGNKIYKDNPQVWKTLSDNWQETFKELTVTVACHVNIRNSAINYKPIQVGD